MQETGYSHSLQFILAMAVLLFAGYQSHAQVMSFDEMQALFSHRDNSGLLNSSLAVKGFVKVKTDTSKNYYKGTSSKIILYRKSGIIDIAEYETNDLSYYDQCKKIMRDRRFGTTGESHFENGITNSLFFTEDLLFSLSKNKKVCYLMIRGNSHE